MRSSIPTFRCQKHDFKILVSVLGPSIDNSDGTSEQHPPLARLCISHVPPRATFQRFLHQTKHHNTVSTNQLKSQPHSIPLLHPRQSRDPRNQARQPQGLYRCPLRPGPNPRLHEALPLQQEPQSTGRKGADWLAEDC